MRPCLRSLTFGSAAAAAAVITLAAQPVRKQRVGAAPGADPVRITSSVGDGEVVDYVVRGVAGQTLRIDLAVGSPSVVFDVRPPGADTLIFFGETRGPRFAASLAKSGDYTTRVRLTPEAARRGLTTSYTISFALDSAAAEGRCGLGSKAFSEAR